MIEQEYKGVKVHFSPSKNNVMVNATEMAEIYDKRVQNFIRLESTEKFISALINAENSSFDSSDMSEQKARKDVIYGTNKATFMHRKLALKFAAWLDVEFELWVFSVIDSILYGNYNKHWEAHAIQEENRLKMENLKQEMLSNPTKENVFEYFNAEREVKAAKSEKTKAIKAQLKLFSSEVN